MAIGRRKSHLVKIPSSTFDQLARRPKADHSAVIIAHAIGGTAIVVVARPQSGGGTPTSSLKHPKDDMASFSELRSHRVFSCYNVQAFS